MKRILALSSTFPASSSDPVPAFVKDQIIALKELQPELEFSVLAPHDARTSTARYTEHEAYTEYRFHYFWPNSSEKLTGRGIMPTLKANPLYYLVIPFLFLGEFVALLRLTRRLKPDVLYAHWFTPQAITACWVSAITGVPFVFTTHASDVEVWHKIPLLGALVVRSTTRKARGFTAVSRRSMAKLERFFTASEWQTIKKRGAIIPMGITLPAEGDSEASDNQTIVFMGRLAEKKGVRYLIEAFTKLASDYPNAKLVIAGDGPLKNSLERQAKATDVASRIEFTGFVSGKAKQRVLRSAGLYVVPSIIASSGDAEGLPVALMEGLAAGKVCIATIESGADDILTSGKDGFLVPQKDVQALANTLESALALSASGRASMAREAKKTAEQFAWPHVARQTSDFLFK